MTSSTETFFEELSRRGHEPSLRSRAGTVRFDIVRGKSSDQWIVAIDDGDIAVTRGNGPASCVIRADEALFEALTTGEAHPMAAMLRGTLLTEGDAAVMVAARRLLTTPPESGRTDQTEPAESRPVANSSRRTS